MTMAGANRPAADPWPSAVWCPVCGGIDECSCPATPDTRRLTEPSSGQRWRDAGGTVTVTGEWQYAVRWQWADGESETGEWMSRERAEANLRMDAAAVAGQAEVRLVRRWVSYGPAEEVPQND